ncbi:hypothetical protein [Pontibacter pamirensis]|uniref:hypothetical protein n=1 Tax=Pontibacter pamirensis TaxID=2562824 RepID=UPI0013895376|nr:hypothetical protein [Pontibacter pamirensis]
MAVVHDVDYLVKEFSFAGGRRLLSGPDMASSTIAVLIHRLPKEYTLLNVKRTPTATAQ